MIGWYRGKVEREKEKADRIALERLEKVSYQRKHYYPIPMPNSICKACPDSPENGGSGMCHCVLPYCH